MDVDNGMILERMERVTKLYKSLKESGEHEFPESGFFILDNGKEAIMKLDDEYKPKEGEMLFYIQEIKSKIRIFLWKTDLLKKIQIN